MTEPLPALVAWESTRACNLACIHCRAEAQRNPSPGELSTGEAFRLVDQIAEFARPILIITGGEPMMRDDTLDVARYAADKGLRVVMSPNGTLLDAKSARAIKETGVMAISVSLDGSTPDLHDSFRQVPGCFEGILDGLAYAREAGLPFQVNTTVNRHNLEDLPGILKLAESLGAVAWDVFMLVPTGRGKIDDEISPEEYEGLLEWVYDAAQKASIRVKVTCGPHYQRVWRQKAKEAGEVQSRREGTTQAKSDVPVKGGVLGQGHHPGRNRAVRGCMAGDGFCFVSHLGDVYPCGYFPVQAGSIREEHFRSIYQESDLFRELRDLDNLKGRCGRCEFRKVCGGCRARAYSTSGDYLAEEPFCIYQPGRSKPAPAG